MIDYSHPILLFCRRLGQRLGILGPLVGLYRGLFTRAYESRFDAAMLEQINAGDVVWDVGANVGYFTTRFADKVGPAGKVYAFEPSKSTLALQAGNCASHANIALENMALSDLNGELWFRDSGIAGDPNNGLTDKEVPNATRIPVYSGDELVSNRQFPMPNAIKIDVEGFELDVISGLARHILPDPRLTRLFIEVHFLQLNQRGLKDAPQQLVATLKQSGFSVQWADPSHLLARRARPPGESPTA
jgi:FkbM family methyltransferase